MMRENRILLFSLFFSCYVIGTLARKILHKNGRSIAIFCLKSKRFIFSENAYGIRISDGGTDIAFRDKIISIHSSAKGAMAKTPLGFFDATAYGILPFSSFSTMGNGHPLEIAAGAVFVRSPSSEMCLKITPMTLSHQPSISSSRFTNCYVSSSFFSLIFVFSLETGNAGAIRWKRAARMTSYCFDFIFL